MLGCGSERCRHPTSHVTCITNPYREVASRHYTYVFCSYCRRQRKRAYRVQNEGIASTCELSDTQGAILTYVCSLDPDPRHELSRHYASRLTPVSQPSSFMPFLLYLPAPTSARFHICPLVESSSLQRVRMGKANAW